MKLLFSRMLLDQQHLECPGTLIESMTQMDPIWDQESIQGDADLIARGKTQLTANSVLLTN